MIKKLLFLGTMIYFLLARNTGDELYVFLSAYLAALTVAVWCHKKDASHPDQKSKEES